MISFNEARHFISFLITIYFAFTFAEKEPDFGFVIIVYWLFSFGWSYYHEFSKPRDERSYASIAASIGFMLGLGITMTAGAGYRTILLGGMIGLGALYVLWTIFVFFLKDKYPYLKPKPSKSKNNGGDNIEEDKLYEDIGGEGEW